MTNENVLVIMYNTGVRRHAASLGPVNNPSRSRSIMVVRLRVLGFLGLGLLPFLI